ncbi:CTB family bacteriocin [Calothrix sp. UHCC 0171]|uniref:CTB family bacteriocin n=1 Tax=Calothrix sp. UHCC 0171 TaxID=3110245 RepID=UPI002B20D6EC|nr:CTB family bacteriocin [Calothrix sp. UHCC 0171]MEA5570798.1 CTB family bacteriocin [Calothrix sp. UHCC 0171]
MLSTKSELFVEVVEEEQEVVSGGQVFFDSFAGHFSRLEGVTGGTAATPLGAVSTGTAVNQTIASIGFLGIRVTP